MKQDSEQHPDDLTQARLAEQRHSEYHPWRLLGLLAIVLVVLAGIAFGVDVLVLGL